MRYFQTLLCLFLICSCDTKSEILPTDFRVDNGLLYDSIHYLKLSRPLDIKSDIEFVNCIIGSSTFSFSKVQLITYFDKIKDLSSQEIEIINFIKENKNIQFSLNPEQNPLRSGTPISWYFCEMLDKGYYSVDSNKVLYEIEYLEYTQSSFTKSKRYIDIDRNIYWFCPPIETADFE